MKMPAPFGAHSSRTLKSIFSSIFIFFIMKKALYLHLLFSAGCLFLISSCGDGNDPVLPSCTDVHWNYDNGTEEGPDHWGGLCVDYTDCSGSIQSPVNIAGASDDASLESLDEVFGTTGTHIVNNGHTIQFNTDAGTSLTYEGVTYKLLQFHTHTPSEHTVNGVFYDMEVHFVHKNDATGKLAVIGVLVNEGTENDFLEHFVHHLPPTEDAKYDDAALTFSIADFLPANKNYFTYGGSLTTPPCSEIVTWLVLESPVEASHEQIEDFHALEHTNNRPVQDLHGRAIKHFHM